MTLPAHRAPFAPGGSNEIDPAICRKLLEAALSRSGEYADVFFEYRAASGFSFEEGILKAASRGVSMGVGIRVQKGEKTGFAYSDDLDASALLASAQSARAIARDGHQHAGQSLARIGGRKLYPALDPVSSGRAPQPSPRTP